MALVPASASFTDRCLLGNLLVEPQLQDLRGQQGFWRFLPLPCLTLKIQPVWALERLQVVVVSGECVSACKITSVMSDSM